jgi:hypothetical protein
VTLAPVLSAGAVAIVDRWSEAVALRGPGALQGSVVDLTTMSEPAAGAYAFTVRLRDGVHGRDAATEAAKRAVETYLGFGVDTAQLHPDRDDATRLRVTLTPARHLEKHPVPWPGPVLHDDGSVPIADTPDGGEVAVGLWNADGVEHVAVFGTTGAGKSSTTAALALPGPAAGVETLWVVDGAQGSSTPYLAPACDWYARTPEQWAAALDAAHAVLTSRKTRRGTAGVHRWRGPHLEDDPILTVLVDEATTVAAKLPRRYDGIVRELQREGRKLGVRVVQVAQDPMGTDLLGGRQARDLMSTIIAHRPGGSMAGRLSVDSTSDQSVDLRALPPEPGFAAIIRKGRVLAPVARVRYASGDAAGHAAARVEVRALTGADATAAGPAYQARHTTGRGEREDGDSGGDEDAARPPAPATPAPDRPGEPGAVPAPRRAPEDRPHLRVASAASGGSTTGESGRASSGPDRRAGPVSLRARDVVAAALAAADGPVTRARLIERTRLSAATVTRALLDLEAEGLARRVPGQKWQPADLPPGGDAP